MSTLKFQVICGKSLSSKDSNGFSDPYVIVEVDKDTKKIKKIKKTLNPEWNETLYFSNVDYDHVSIKVTVMDWDKIASDDFMGEYIFGHSDIVQAKEGTLDKFLPLQKRKGKDKDIVSGEVHVKVQFVQNPDPSFVIKTKEGKTKEGKTKEDKKNNKEEPPNSSPPPPPQNNPPPPQNNPPPPQNNPPPPQNNPPPPQNNVIPILTPPPPPPPQIKSIPKNPPPNNPNNPPPNNPPKNPPPNNPPKNPPPNNPPKNPPPNNPPPNNPSPNKQGPTPIALPKVALPKVVLPPKKQPELPKAKVEYDFLAEGEGEVSVSFGDILDIIEEDGDWLKIKSKDGIEGFVPANYVTKL